MTSRIARSRVALLWVFLVFLPLENPWAALRAESVETLEKSEIIETRLRDIAAELRCLVCQNESLSSSSADLARDLRALIRLLIEEGKSDTEILEFMTARYGDFIRYRPPLKRETLLLWFGPALLLAGALGGFLFQARQRARTLSVPPLEAHERAYAETLLKAEQETPSRPRPQEFV